MAHRKPASVRSIRRTLGLTSRARFMPNCGNCGQPIHPVTGAHQDGARCSLHAANTPAVSVWHDACPEWQACKTGPAPDWHAAR